jgi:GNAT superfamily N-acetyltransferase
MGSPPRSTGDPSHGCASDRVARGASDSRGPRQAVVRGTSMEPTLASGDEVTLAQGRDARAIATGEIVTFRDDEGRVVTHRVLGTERLGGSRRVVTQGDGRTEPDPAWPEERLIGRVTAASRPPPRLARRLVAFDRLAWWELAERAATRVRSWRFVRTLQHRAFRSDMPIRVERRLPESGSWLAITCTAAGVRKTAAGWLTAVRESPGVEEGPARWLSFGLQVRLRYRGLGLGRRLVAATEAAVRREGGGLLYGFVRPANRPSLALFRSAGWSVAPPPEGSVRGPELASCLCVMKIV